MIRREEENNQILSSQCLHCPDPYFAPFSEEFPHVGCCSYSPVFTLFEIHRMVKEDPQFFWDHIFNHPNKKLNDYSITVHAKINDRFFEMDQDSLSHLQKEDLKLQYSVCQFFVLDQGCGLKPRYKNVTCRSFICSAIENQLTKAQQEDLIRWVTQIRAEAQAFVIKHEKVLSYKGWTLKQNSKDIIRYLQNL